MNNFNPLLTDSGLSDKTIQSINFVFAKYPEIEKAILYGSRAKGNFKPGSDIDLTLIGEKLSTQIQMDVDDLIDDLYLPYKIDLSIYTNLRNPDLKEHIDRVGVVFYENQNLI